MPPLRLLLATAFLSTPLAAAEWQAAPVPGRQNFSGVAWYRAWLKPHPTFFSKHERDLFAESVVMGVRGVAEAHEVYVNGTKVGAGGAFPPDFVSGKDGNHRHKIPPGVLVKDQWNEIAVRVFTPAGPGGFFTEAPFVLNYFNECVLEGNWEFHPGEDAPLDCKARAEKPAVATFDSYHDANRVLGEAAQLVHGEKLSPADSFAKMTAAEDLQVELMLAEPLVAQPVHLSFDERGRLWVAQYRQYPYPAGLKMLSRDRYYRSHYDKVPPAPPNHARGRDVISIHEDTDGDGLYDRHKVFQDGLNMANAALRGRGGVWVMHTPYLLFYPDKDFDDLPDGPPVVHLQGFGLEDTHSVANGIVWGMDGWLYGAQGSTTSCRVTRPGLDGTNAPGVYFEGCMVWRYHPETRAFELFSEGGGNNFGLDLDAQGRLFTGHNGGTTRGWHYLQNGYYEMQGVNPGKFGPPRNPFAFGDLPKMASEQPVQRFTHFAAMVECTALPAKYQGSFFSVDPLHNFVIASLRRPLGATFDTTDIGKVLTSGDFAFRPVYIADAPDGSMLVADFYEHYIAHGQHYQSQIDPTTGRIFRLRGRELPLELDLNLERKSTTQLVALLGHANKWHRHTAVRLLGERKDAKARGTLRRLIESDPGQKGLCALWAHYQAFGLDDPLALIAIRHPYAPMRYWAVRLAGDDGKVSAGLFDALMEQARYEPNAEVRSQIAGSARRLPAPQALGLVKALLRHPEDVKDAYVPLMTWWVIEALADSSRADVLALFDDRELWDEPMMFEHILPRISRRFALQGRNADLLDCAKLLGRAPEKRHAARLVAGIETAYQGRPMSGLPEELLRALVQSGSSSPVLRLRLGERAAVPVALELARNARAATPERVSVVRALADLREPSAQPVLLDLAAQPGPVEVRRAAVTGLMRYDQRELGNRVAKLVPALPAELQAAALDLLLSRAQWTRALLAAVQSGGIPPALVPPEMVRRLRGHADKGIQQSVTKLFPGEAGGEKVNWTQRVMQLELVLKAAPGNPYDGEQFFEQRCAVCHKLFFKGGAIGPDLTAYQRDKLDTMLVSILNPNVEIREGFQYYSVETKDDRSLSGFLTDQDNQVVVLRGLGGEDIRLQRAEIKELQPMGRSLMPEGLLEGMTDQQLRDFFAYLRISQPITR